MGIELSVQPVAAKQYISELIAVGILTEDNKATALADMWRLDATYKNAVSQLIARVYPQGLLDVAPSDGGDRQKAITWFQHEGLGQGTAKNKAATYFLLGTPDPNESPTRSASSKNTVNEAVRIHTSKRNTDSVKKGKTPVGSNEQRDGARQGSPDMMPLNVNLQIHISADAGSDQIEAIFSAMRRYLHDQQGS